MPDQRADPSAQHFETTEWSAVLAAGRGEIAESQAALEKLCRAYWPPIYGYARGRGHSEHDAQDLTQGFFADLLRRDSLAAADPDRGRFRTFLLTAFQRFMALQWRKTQTAKRGGTKPWIPLEDLYEAEERLPKEAMTLPPESLFDLQWAERVFLGALDKLRAEYERAGKSAEFTQLCPFISRSGTASEYAKVAAQFGWKPESVAVAAHRLRRRYGEMTRTEVARTLERPEDIDDELRRLAAFVAA